MYEQNENKKTSFKALELFLSKLPKNSDTLFPLPIKKDWYSNRKNFRESVGNSDERFFKCSIVELCIHKSFYKNHGRNQFEWNWVPLRVWQAINLRNPWDGRFAKGKSTKNRESVMYCKTKWEEILQLQNKSKFHESTKRNCIGKEMVVKDFQGKLKLSGTFNNFITFSSSRTVRTDMYLRWTSDREVRCVRKTWL